MPDSGPGSLETAGDVSDGRQVPWWMAGVLVAAMGAASVLVLDPDARDAKANEPTRVVASSDAPAPLLASSASPPVTLPDSGARSKPAAATEPAEQIQICGGDWVTPPADGSSAPARVEAMPNIRAAHDRILAAMRADPDGYARAVAGWLESAELNLGDPSDLRRWRADVHQLADTAVHTADPRTYALAYGACNAHRDDAACAQLKAEQWARLDPENGHPWLFVAGEAAQRRDDAARDEALYRLSMATRFDSRIYDAPRAIVAHAGHDDASLVAAHMLIVHALGMVAAFPVPYTDVLKTCRVRIEQDPNRWQTCSAAATLLAERSDTLLDRSMGRSMGRRLEWPLERQDRLAGEAARWMQQLNSLTSAAGEGGSGGCVGIRNLIDVVARGSEVVAVKAALAASAAGDDELLRLGQAERERSDLTRQRPNDPNAAATVTSMPSTTVGVASASTSAGETSGTPSALEPR